MVVLSLIKIVHSNMVMANAFLFLLEHVFFLFSPEKHRGFAFIEFELAEVSSGE